MQNSATSAIIKYPVVSKRAFDASLGNKLAVPSKSTKPPRPAVANGIFKGRIGYVGFCVSSRHAECL